MPTDRIRDFEVAFGSYADGHALANPQPGSSMQAWQDVEVPVDDAGLAAFYNAFATWLSKATSAPPALPDLDAAALKTFVNDLPRREQGILALLSDADGRTVTWGELKTKFGLVGKPVLSRDLPELSANCRTLQCRVPITLETDGDETLLTLAHGLIRPVARLAKNWG